MARRAMRRSTTRTSPRSWPRKSSSGEVRARHPHLRHGHRHGDLRQQVSRRPRRRLRRRSDRRAQPPAQRSQRALPCRATCSARGAPSGSSKSGWTPNSKAAATNAASKKSASSSSTNPTSSPLPSMGRAREGWMPCVQRAYTLPRPAAGSRWTPRSMLKSSQRIVMISFERTSRNAFSGLNRSAADDNPGAQARVVVSTFGAHGSPERAALKTFGPLINERKPAEFWHWSI